MQKALRPIVITGLIVGAMDITAATVTAVLLGPSAFARGWSAAAVGLALHFVIAFAVVALFYFASRRWELLHEKPVLCGMAYGAIVFAVMNLVVVPLSSAKPRHALVPDLIQLAIHMFIIGVPTALLLRRFSGAKAG